MGLEALTSKLRQSSQAIMVNSFIFICCLMLLWLNNLDYFCILQLKHLSAMLLGRDASAMCFYGAVMVHRDLYRCQDGPPQGVWMFLRSRNTRSCNKEHGPQITTEFCLIWNRLFTPCTVKLFKINVAFLKKRIAYKIQENKDRERMIIFNWILETVLKWFKRFYIVW